LSGIAVNAESEFMIMISSASGYSSQRAFAGNVLRKSRERMNQVKGGVMPVRIRCEDCLHYDSSLKGKVTDLGIEVKVLKKEITAQTNKIRRIEQEKSRLEQAKAQTLEKLALLKSEITLLKSEAKNLDVEFKKLKVINENIVLEAGKLNSELSHCGRENHLLEEARDGYLRNQLYYAGLLDEVAKHLGEDVFVSDDGSVQDTPLRAKIPGMVAAIKADLAEKSHDIVFLNKQISTLDGIANSYIQKCDQIKTERENNLIEFRKNMDVASGMITALGKELQECRQDRAEKGVIK
jgi:DNA repair exonuclease SbcCD ATPase subunit